MEKYVYYFGGGKAEGKGDMKKLLGGKGAGLAEMTNIGLPVPPGFTITTEVCTYNYKNNGFPEGLDKLVEENLKMLEKEMGLSFGSSEKPLLLSVRSGARVSMPGMMDTVLNIGLNDETIKGLARLINNERFAYDSYRRLLQMFGNVVLGIKHEKFEEILTKKKEERRIKYDMELSTEDLKEIIKGYNEIVKIETGKEFPQDAKEQLWLAIGAVFSSWNTPRAKTYRKINHIPEAWGTAANVQTMVFGNMGPGSGTGVGFTRSPSTGENKLYGEYLMNAQGEDVVAGIRTPQPIARLKDELPEIYEQLSNTALDHRKTLQGYPGFRIHHSKRKIVHAPDQSREENGTGSV